jgi:hypothetical protein
LIRFARASSNYSDFLKRHLHLRNRLLTLIKKKKLTFLFLTTYLYTFSLCENPSFMIFSAETEYISTRSWYRNINFLRHRIKFGAVMTTVLPVVFKHCYKYCHSDSRRLWAVMKGGGLAL